VSFQNASEILLKVIVVIFLLKHSPDHGVKSLEHGVNATFYILCTGGYGITTIVKNCKSPNPPPPPLPPPPPPVHNLLLEVDVKSGWSKKNADESNPCGAGRGSVGLPTR
jgi:hypothetical protein